MTDQPIIVVTGATNGLGRLAALELARRGSRLVITARSADKAAHTRAELEAAAPAAHVDTVFADFSNLNEVRSMGEDIAERHGHVDALINNAGLHAFEPRTTPDGYSEMIAVNYLAPFVLTDTLLPSLRNARNARIVNVASEAARNHGTLRIPADLTDTTSFTARGSSERYGKTKLMNIMFTLELARQLEATGITVNCLDPGFNVTGLGRELRFAGALERILTTLGIGDPRRGSDLIVALATDPRFGEVTGRYITAKGSREIAPVPPADDLQAQAELWAATRELVGT